MLTINKMNKKGQDAGGGFGIILPIVIILMISGFVLTVFQKINTDLVTLYGGVGASATNASQVAAKITVATTSFSGNFGTFFSLALLAVIIGIVAIFLVRRQ